MFIFPKWGEQKKKIKPRSLPFSVCRFFFLLTSFQDDKDLVHEFVVAEGLTCLIKVGAEADQNYQNYILRGTSGLRAPAALSHTSIYGCHGPKKTAGWGRLWGGGRGLGGLGGRASISAVKRSRP